MEKAFGEVDDCEIYPNVIGGSSYDRILGLATEVKCKYLCQSPNVIPRNFVNKLLAILEIKQ